MRCLGEGPRSRTMGCEFEVACSILVAMNSNLSWLQQLGYDFMTLQADISASVQRLRRQSVANARHRGAHRACLHKEDRAASRPSRLRAGHRKSRLRRYGRKQKGTAITSFEMGIKNAIELSHLTADVTDPIPPLERRAADATQVILRQARRARAPHHSTAMACPKASTRRLGVNDQGPAGQHN
jgi:hypothetical protein